MIYFFRKIRRALLANNRFYEYFLYAIGEIVLVVIGILLALQINNWNEARKNDKQLHQLLATIRQDIQSDTIEVRQILDNYELRKPVFEKVLNDSATLNDYMTQPFFGVLVTSYIPLTIEERGYTQLKNFHDFNGREPETIASQITEFYSVFLKNIGNNEKAIKEDAFNNLEYWKENMKWFADISKGDLTTGFMDYVLEDPDYKNRVAYHQSFVYGNHIPFLKLFQANAKILLAEIDKKLKDTKK
jgi:hypothetical protein